MKSVRHNVTLGAGNNILQIAKMCCEIMGEKYRGGDVKRQLDVAHYQHQR